MVLSLPVFHALKAKFPEAEIYYLVSPIGEAFIKTQSDKVIPFDFSKKGFFRRYLSLIRTLKREKFSHYISLWNIPSMAYLGWLCQIPIRIGDASTPMLRPFYTHAVKQSWENFFKHQVDLNLELLTPFGLPPIPNTSLKISPMIQEKMKSLIATTLPGSRKNVVIFCGTGGTNFDIPDPVREDLILYLTQTHNVILAGVQSIPISENSHCLNLLGKTTFPELIALLSLADFYIAGDTGPSQIASFLGIPAMIFSPIKPNPPVRWGPLSPWFRIVRNDTNCTHLVHFKNCKDSCLQNVTVAPFVSAFERLSDQVAKGQKWDLAAIRMQHQLASIRILTTSSQEIADHFTHQGLLCFYVPRMGWFNLLKTILRYNINVIHSEDFSPFVIHSIQLTISAVLKYIPPIWVKKQLVQDLKISEVLARYRAIWKA